MLGINHYFFPEVVVRANQSYDPAGNRRGTNVDLDHKLEPIPNEQGKFGLSVTVASKDEDSENQPYYFKIQVYGILEIVDKGKDDEEQKAIVVTLGLPILIGAIREQLASVTSRGPWGNFLLGVIQLQTANESAEEGA